jgi:probable phosphoglycerate mutase
MPDDSSTACGSEQADRSVRMLLLRHGQSEWNAVRRWQGTADTPLTELGRRQAIGTAASLRTSAAEFCGVWSSDLARAGETAGIIAAELDIGPVVADPRLREASAGEWQGMTPDEIELAYPGWLSAHRRPASFETFDAVVDRATSALGSIAGSAATAGSGTSALVVTHSGVIRSVIRHHGATDMRIPNLGGVWLTVDCTGQRSSIGEPVEPRGHLVIGDLYDPDGLVVSGIDAPGEDPGEQPDQTEADRSAQR